MKPDINKFTGCAHITNAKIGSWRICSSCHAGIPDHVTGPNGGFYIDEENVDHCYFCGATFDHTEDEEPMEDD